MRKCIVLLVCLVLAMLWAVVPAGADPYVTIFPRNSMATGGSLDFAYEDIDLSMDQYVHILREEADGTYTVVSVIKAWDAAAEVSVKRVEAGVVTEPGNYWLTLGTDPDYAGTDEGMVVSLPFMVLSEQLAAPVIEDVVTGTAVGTDVSFSIQVPEGTEMTYFELCLMVDGVPVPVYWDNYGTHFNVLGLCTTEPGTYQIRVSAHPQSFGEPASETVADSDTAVYEFTLAEGDIPECPAPVLSVTEADYKPGQDYVISYTVPGAEAVACSYGLVNPGDEDFAGGTGTPNSSTMGDTGTMSADMGPGIYHLFCYGRFNGVWSAAGEAVFTLNPIGYLGIPAVTWQGSPVENALQVSGSDPLVFSVAGENAETISCEVVKKTSDGGFDWLGWIDCPADEDGTAVADLTGLGLDEGTYVLRFISFRDGWLGQGDASIEVTVSSQP